MEIVAIKKCRGQKGMSGIAYHFKLSSPKRLFRMGHLGKDLKKMIDWMFHQGFSRQGEKYENDPEVGINLPSEFKKKKIMKVSVTGGEWAHIENGLWTNYKRH